MKKFIFFLTIFLSVNSVYAGEFDNWDDFDAGDEAMGRVYMDGEFLDGDILKISVLTEDMLTPVLGIAFHLDYEAEKLAFLRYEPGDFLERGGNPFYLVKATPEKEKIVFGETLRRDDAFPMGGGGVSDFYFQILNDEEFGFVFENGVVSTLDTVRQDIDRVVWDNFMLDKNGKRLVGSFDEGAFISDAVRLNTSGFSVFSNWRFMLVVFFAITASLGFMILIKRQEKKRHV